MKTSELQELPVNELHTKAHELYEELCKLKIQHGVRPLENTSTLKNLRKDIARVKTVISAKQN